MVGLTSGKRSCDRCLMLQLVMGVFALVATPTLSTIAEQSGFVRTGRYDEVIRLCDAFAAAYPAKARCVSFGTTPQGRDMRALVLSDGDAKSHPVILAQGGIHAGEIDGKDAGFLVVKQLLDGKISPGVLKKVTFVFVPVFNVDGHERMAKYNRPNQRGPEEMGWRTTAQNFNLNRDYMKADAPEMRAMLRLLNEWDPVLYVDLHVTDGAQFQHDVAVLVDPAVDGEIGPLHDVASKMQHAVIDRLNKAGHKALDFYPSFDNEGDPTSGLSAGVAPPRFSQPYWALHGRMGMLVETHSWKDYQTRVMTTRDVLAAIFAEADQHVGEWSVPVTEPKSVVLAWDNTDAKKVIDFLGYAYTRTPSAVSGALRTRYDESKPQVWKVPFLATVKPVLTVDAPSAYVVPAEHAAWVKEKLDAHGVKYQVQAESKALDVEVFRATEAKLADKSYESHQTVKVKGAWAKEKRSVPAGSLIVTTHQRLGALVVHLFEPLAPDSFLAWGFFNSAFEQKEYMEAYVAEDVADKLLKDPAIAAEFARKLEDPGFAKDPQARLDFFYKKHPSWDEKRDLYPVYRY